MAGQYEEIGMPFEKRIITKEQWKKIDEFITWTGLRKSSCEVCKNQDSSGSGWGIEPFVVWTKGQGDTGAQFISIYCVRCGNAKLFNAVALNRELRLGLNLDAEVCEGENGDDVRRK